MNTTAGRAYECCAEHERNVFKTEGTCLKITAPLKRGGREWPEITLSEKIEAMGSIFGAIILLFAARTWAESPLSCPPGYNPVCDSNGRTHHNECYAVLIHAYPMPKVNHKSKTVCRN